MEGYQGTKRGKQGKMAWLTVRFVLLILYLILTQLIGQSAEKQACYSGLEHSSRLSNWQRLTDTNFPYGDG